MQSSLHRRAPVVSLCGRRCMRSHSVMRAWYLSREFILACVFVSLRVRSSSQTRVSPGRTMFKSTENLVSTPPLRRVVGALREA